MSSATPLPRGLFRGSVTLRAMPNWAHLLTTLVYHLGLAIWIGGAIALGALAAPVLFGNLPRPQAGSLFGPILRRFSRLRLAALIFTIAAAAVKYLVWETHTRSVWILFRWIALGLLALIVVYELAYIEPVMARHRDDPDRKVFTALHKQSEGLMKISLVLAVLAMLLS